MQNNISENISNERRPGWQSFVFYILIGAGLVVIDQLTKAWAFHGKGFEWLNVFFPHIQKQDFVNTNFAFSLPLPALVMYGLYAIVILFMLNHVIQHYREFSKIQSVAWLLIFTGALSNIAERAINGGVRDFIYIFSGIFNFADFYILLGIVLLVIPLGRRKDRI